MAAVTSMPSTSARVCAVKCSAACSMPSTRMSSMYPRSPSVNSRRFVLGAAAADLARQLRIEPLTAGDGLDGVEHLHVAGAATQVRAEVPAHVGTIERSTLLVDLRLGAHDDAGDAEAALQPAACGERFGELLSLVVVDAFQGDHVLAGDLGQRLLTADDCLAVDVHRAAPALTARGATVLRQRSGPTRRATPTAGADGRSAPTPARR